MPQSSGRRAHLQPRRTLVVPFVAVATSFLWFGRRSAELTGGGGTAGEAVELLAVTTVSIALSYFLAVGVATVLRTADRPVPAWARPLARPSNATLASFAVLALAFLGYVFGSSVLVFPQWIDRAAALAGPVLGLPLVVTYGGSIVVGNAIGVEAPFAVESAIVGLGVALSVAWAFFLVGRAVLLLGLSAGSKSEATKT